jgi:uncharacterized protein YraI
MLFLMLPIPAFAQIAFTTQPVNIRAGPDRAFPLVSWLPGGASVNVVGCIDGWRWCDVIAGRSRGWVYARFLSFSFQNQMVPVMTGGARLGLPLITFSVGPYWDRHFRGRPWYSSRSQWMGWHPPSRHPSRPRPGQPPSRPPPQRPPSRPRPGPGTNAPIRPPLNIPPSGSRPPR